MKVIQVLINKKQDNSEFYTRVQRKEFSFLEFIDAYMLSLAYLDSYDPLLKKKSLIWRRFISMPITQRQEFVKKMFRFRDEQFRMIIKAFNKIDKEKLENPLAFGSIYKPYTFGCLEYEYDAQK